MKVDIYTEDEEWITSLKDTKGWGCQIYISSGTVQGLFTGKFDSIFKAQSHKRQQNYLISICLKRLFQSGSRR